MLSFKTSFWLEPWYYFGSLPVSSTRTKSLHIWNGRFTFLDVNHSESILSVNVVHPILLQAVAVNSEVDEEIEFKPFGIEEEKSSLLADHLVCEMTS